MLSAGFPPISSPDARVLILGTLPGQDSLRLSQYYGHPRNAFWPIVTALLGLPTDAPYPERAAALIRHRIALWDVCASARRPGSLDSAIQPASVVVNDFPGFFATHPLIERIFFNGGNAEALYQRLVRPPLPHPLRDLPSMRLPSTSPAYAGMRPEEKRRRWSAVLAPAAAG